MPLNENLKQNSVREGSITDSNSSNLDTHISVDTRSYDNSNINQRKLEPSTFSNSAILFIPIIFVLTTVGVVFYRLKRVKTESYPCKNCKYYNSNNYLKCAVNPAEVLTDKAKDCRDYCSLQQKFTWSWKGFDKRD